MEFNYGLLKQRIKDEYGTYGRFAAELGIPYQRLSKMLNNQSEWRQDLICTAADLLDGWAELRTYFFTLKVPKSEHYPNPTDSDTT